MATEMHRGSGNVFIDVGFPPAEAARKLIRSQLMILVSQRITELGLTQKQAARVMNVTQPRVSDLVRGRIRLFSIDALIEMAEYLGVSVTLKTKRRKRVA